MNTSLRTQAYVTWSMLCCLPWLSACQPTVPAEAALPDPRWRIAQVGHGAEARFILCTAMTCPAVTAKTLASQPLPSTTRREQVAFDVASDRLTSEAQTLLDSVASELPYVERLSLVGFTDSTGSPASNQHLALKRAQAVHDYLMRESLVSVPQMAVNGQGACCYVAPNTTTAGRQANRRVELELHYRSQP